MKRIVFILPFLIFLIPLTRIQAGCSFTLGKPYSVNTTFEKQDANNGTITFSGKTFHVLSPQCTTLTQSNTLTGTKTVYCDNPTEIYSYDSVRQPWCGSVEERGKVNSTCWQCESDTICDGFDQAAGDSNPMFNRSIPFEGSSQMWIASPPGGDKFKYNGVDYDYNGQRILYCGPNNLACGNSKQCTNLVDKNINNRGNGSTPEKQCTTVTRDIPAANDTDINVKKRGWANASETIRDLIDVPGPTDPKAPQLSTMLGDSLTTSPTITGLYQVNLNDGKTPIPKDERSNWGVTLMELNTNAVIRAPKSGYEINSVGYTYTVLYATENDITLKGTLEDNAVYGYTLHVADFNVNPEILQLYRQNEQSGRKQLLAIPCGYPLGTPLNSKFKVGVADTGTFIDPRVRKDWWHEPTNNSCANIPPGLVTPQSTQICTVKAAPQATGVGHTAGAVNFCDGCTDKKGFVFALLQKQIIELQGEVFPSKINKQSTLQVPDLSFYAGWLRRASPYLSPLEIQKKEKPITSSFSVSSTANVSADSDEPKDTCYQQKQGVITTKFPFLNTVLEHALKLDAFLGPFGKQNNFNFDPRYPNQTLTDRDTRGCPEQTPGIPVAPAPQKSEFENVFSDIPEILKPVLLAAVRIADTWGLISAGGKCKAGKDGCSTGGGYSAQIYVHSLTPYGDREIADHIGVTHENKSKGFVRTFLPSQSRKTFSAAVINNEFDHPGLFNPVPVRIPFPFAGIGGALQNLDDLRCTLTPRSLQTPDMHCNDVMQL